MVFDGCYYYILAVNDCIEIIYFGIHDERAQCRISLSSIAFQIFANESVINDRIDNEYPVHRLCDGIQTLINESRVWTMECIK